MLEPEADFGPFDVQQFVMYTATPILNFEMSKNAPRRSGLLADLFIIGLYLCVLAGTAARLTVLGM